MKVCVGDVYDWIESFAPFENALSFDNVGLLVGSRTQQTDKVMMALDITPDVVKEAAAWGAGLIVSHHPVIFHPLKQVAKESAVYQLARHEMAAVCAHTNLDFAPSFGVNTELARALGLSNTRRVLPCEQVMEALMGELPRTFSALELAEKVKNDLHAESVRVVDGGKPIRQVAVCSGAGADCLDGVQRLGADALVTGESRHHQLLQAKDMGMTLITVGHFATETIVLPAWKEKMEQQFPGLSVRIAEANQEPECQV